MASIDRYSKVGADIKVQRSRFPMTRRVPYSYFHGYLQPVGSPIEVLPGDTFKASLSAYVRMSTPIVPFIDDIRAEYDAFFVPKRILWDKTKQFYGESPSFGIATAIEEPTCPVSVVGTPRGYLSNNIDKSESISCAFGIIWEDTGVSFNERVNVLPIRALFSIYNEYYRNENYQDQYTWDKSQYGQSVTVLAYLGGLTVNAFSLLPKVNKDGDLITSILPYQIKGAPVTLSVGESAPVRGIEQGTSNPPVGQLGVGSTGSGNAAFGFSVNNNQFIEINATQGGSVQASGNGKVYDMVADLRNVTAVNISDLLYALAYQDFLARAAHFGTRYKEYIYSMFGTVIADATEDIPEYLGRLKFNINVNQVVQTTGFAPSTNTELGSLGAYSVSGDSKKLFTKSFTEPGYVVIVGYTKHKRTYSSGIDRVFLKRELLDYYQPPFANIPDVPFGSYNLWFEDAVGSETSLGFQEPFWDNRVLQDRAYGMMNPMNDTLGQLWTLAEKWSTKPTINGAFMKEDRDALARVLVTGVNGPDYLIDTLLTIDATRVMPLYSSGKLGRF